MVAPGSRVLRHEGEACAGGHLDDGEASRGELDPLGGDLLSDGSGDFYGVCHRGGAGGEDFESGCSAMLLSSRYPKTLVWGADFQSSAA